MSRPISAEPRLHFLDGMRGWGALFVVLYHLFIQITPVSTDAARWMSKLFVFNGFLAVIVFFFVSGFSLSIGFIKTKNKERLLALAIARYFRLTVPILLACLLVAAANTANLIPRQYVSLTSDNVLDTVRFSLWGVYFSFSPPLSPIPPLWTMRYELIGSVIVFAILFLAVGPRLRLYSYGTLAPWLFFVAPLLSAFIIGMAGADLWAMRDRIQLRKKLQVMSAFAIVPALIAAAWLPGCKLIQFWTTVGCVLGLSVTFHPALSALMETRISIFLGAISFPLYLTHALVIRVVEANIFHASDAPWRVVVANCGIVLAAILFATAFRWIDTAGVFLSRFVASFSASRMLLIVRHISGQ